MTNNSSTYSAAKDFYNNGITVIPIRGDGTKAPAIRAWQDHTTTPDDITSWFAPHPQTGRAAYTAIGVVTGPKSGNLEMAEIEGEFIGELPTIADLAANSGLSELWEKINTGWVERSPSGGIHWFYRVEGQEVPGNTKLAQRALPAPPYRVTVAETRGKGGQVVVAPSPGTAHETGKPWERVAGGPSTVPTITAEEQEQLHALLGTLGDQFEHHQHQQEAAPTGGLEGLLGGLEAADQHRQELYGGTTPGDDYENRTSWEQILEPAGWKKLFNRGQTIYWVRPGKDHGISATTGHAADRDRLFVFTSSTEFTPEVPYTKFGAYALLHHGGDHTRAASELRKSGYGETARVVHPSATTAAPAPPAPPAPAVAAGDNVIRMPEPAEREQGHGFSLITTSLPLTDDANAMELIRHHGEWIRYNQDQARWLTWQGHRWAVEPASGGYARELAKQTARQLPENGPEGADKMLRHKRYSLSDRGITALLKTAATDPSITVSSNDLDHHPLELNTPGGIVDLTTGELHPSDPSRLHTLSTTVTPDPEADSSRWDQFLAQTFPDPAIREYIQRLAGYSAIGEVRAHILPFAYGSGGNGKGVFLEAIKGVLGTYASTAPAGFLMAARYDQHATELADLAGKRLVICSEVNENDRFDEARVKALTGGDTVKARFMRQDFFEFKPTHHLWLMGNHQPHVDSGGEGFWRRLRLIPFTHTVPEKDRVEDLQTILATEHGPAVLWWVIQGAVKFLRDGLQEPEGVQAATDDYKSSADGVGQFLEEACHTGPGFEDAAAPVAAVRAAYEEWCREAGERPLTGRAFTAQLARHGIKTGRNAPKGSGGMRMYGGIALPTPEPQLLPNDGDRGGW